ncbi:MAG: protein kinase [Acidobacteria bacterium]|nr:protein kinase [Acidobacteriota bacterium]
MDDLELGDTSESRQSECPNCEAAIPPDAPAGLCPQCALRAGLAETRGADADRGPRPGIDVVDLAARLPELEGFTCIGRGGMGAVFRARHTRLNRDVAVKVLDPSLRASTSFAARFEREAQAMAQLAHPNIVSVHDFGHRDDLHYLVMEFVDGVTLRQTIDSGGMRPAEALAVIPRICEALQYAHDRGVVHRDIKPENILISRSGKVKIVDFGLAKLVAGDVNVRLTGSRQVMGTPSYMAPEQIEHPDTVDSRADIFALGVVFYELLTGELPIGRFPPPSRHASVDGRLDEVVLRALEKEPELRYQHASEMQADVECVSDAEPDTTRPAPAPASPATESVARSDFEYRSRATALGIPLVHIASSRDPEGKRMRVASGVIAIGDIAIGVVAIGAFGFGGIVISPLAIGLMSFGGAVFGALTALGGVAFGGFAVGGFAAGLFGARGAAAFSAWDRTSEAVAQVTVYGWLAMTIGFTIATVAAGYAWISATRARSED